jgi:hypothetical protein
LNPTPADVLTGEPDATVDYDPAELAALVRRGRSYAVVHRTCGHVLGVPTDRGQAATLIEGSPQAIRHQLRVRVATGEDLVASLRAHRCAICTTDGRITGSAAR